MDPFEQLRAANKRNLQRVSVGNDVHAKDDKITDDELTPVVLRDGKVGGIGHSFLAATRKD